VRGKQRVEAVTVAQVDADGRPMPQTAREIPCDLLVLAVGLIPENELSRRAGAEMHPLTKGPVLDENFMTSLPGIFAAGNVAAVFDLVDYVSQSGETAARGAVAYLRGELPPAAQWEPVAAGENIRFVVPQRVCTSRARQGVFYLRVSAPRKGARLLCEQQGSTLLDKAYRNVAPAEMLAAPVAWNPGGGLRFSMEGGEAS
jgi:heterodisulfide reductase subunit A-like polyferredoxin